MTTAVAQASTPDIVEGSTVDVASVSAVSPTTLGGSRSCPRRPARRRSITRHGRKRSRQRTACAHSQSP